MARVELSFEDIEVSRVLFGERDGNLKQLAESMEIDVSARGNEVRLTGPEHDLALARDLLQQLYSIAQRGHPLFPPDIDRSVKILSGDRRAQLHSVFLDSVFISSDKKIIAPKTFNQKRYIDAIRHHDLVFGVGPAGTGKTYLAMAMALSALSKRKVKRIVLTRPAVEAGEKLGFLPGDMSDKVSPYLRPLYDALHDMLSSEKAARMIEDNIIEVAPLAFMRGRTLNDSFVILDEAQNTTSEQMKMFLTRLGFNSRGIITGDLTQTDLPGRTRSGLEHACRILDGIDGISFIRFSEVDVVRHPLVQKIILAYEREWIAERAAAPP